MELTNTLAYYDMATITVLKSFIVQAIDWNWLSNVTSNNVAVMITKVKSFIIQAPESLII